MCFDVLSSVKTASKDSRHNFMRIDSIQACCYPVPFKNCTELKNQDKSEADFYDLLYATVNTFLWSDMLPTRLQHQSTYGQLAVSALRTYGILCLGLYRLLKPDNVQQTKQKAEQSPKLNRYVITHPPFAFKLLPSDKVKAFHPISSNAETH